MYEKGYATWKMLMYTCMCVYVYVYVCMHTCGLACIPALYVCLFEALLFLDYVL